MYEHLNTNGRRAAYWIVTQVYNSFYFAMRRGYDTRSETYTDICDSIGMYCAGGEL